MRLIFSLFALVFSLSVTAQRTDGSIRGRILDSVSNQPVAGATVSLLQAVDSSLVTFTVSNKNGQFEFKGIAAGNYKVVVAHQSLEPLRRAVSITTENPTVDLVDIKGSPAVKHWRG